ncbi:MAG: hypothetical protein QOJ16_4717 [Acidobacteriota bacterium]|jgi:uncharacterized protein (DUF1015 family)|nr:hypothetical protein [Acidobacteriota bacterium]
MRLYAFEGLHYKGKAEDAGRLAAPPYDQIDDRARDRFHAQSPHQFAHLIKPVSEGGLDPYQHAAALHARWLAEGTIEHDPRPALYPYVIILATGGRRLGVCGLVELADAGEIRPHEQTLDKPLADRLALLRATHVDLEPVFLLSEDGGRLNRLIEEDTADGTAPLVDHLDADGHHHLLFRVDDPERIARYRDVLAVPSAIADGHHRYKVAQRFAAETGARPGAAAAAKLAVVTSLDSPALTIDPIHRALERTIDLDRLAAAAGATGASRQVWEGDSGGTGAAFAAAVAAAPQPALGVWTAGHRPEIWRLDPGKGPAAMPAGGRDLAVLLLHEVVFPALGLAPGAATDGTVLYRSDPEVLYRMIAAGEAGTGLWLPPMQPAAFAAAIAHGDMLPPKSTRFLPKVMSGLVWGDHGTRLL